MHHNLLQCSAAAGANWPCKGGPLQPYCTWSICSFVLPNKKTRTPAGFCSPDGGIRRTTAGIDRRQVCRTERCRTQLCKDWTKSAKTDCTQCLLSLLGKIIRVRIKTILCLDNLSLWHPKSWFLRIKTQGELRSRMSGHLCKLVSRQRTGLAWRTLHLECQFCRWTKGIKITFIFPFF